MIRTHGMPTSASCLDCMDEIGFGRALVRLERAEIGTMSLYTSDCPECGSEIRPGWPIRKTTHDRWVCDPCGRAMNR